MMPIESEGMRQRSEFELSRLRLRELNEQRDSQRHIKRHNLLGVWSWWGGKWGGLEVMGWGWHTGPPGTLGGWQWVGERWVCELSGGSFIFTPGGLVGSSVL